MKKSLLAILLVFVLVLSFAFIGCTDGEKKDIVIYVPDGAPALSMASLMKEGATLDGRKVTVYVSSGEVVKAKLLAKEADIVILPVSAGAKLYNAGNDIKLGAVNVWGLNYLVGREQISNLSDLKGELVHSIGKGDTPDIMFKKILTEKGIDFVESDVAVEDKVAIKYYAQGSDIVPLLKSGNAKFAVLGEPVVSKTKAPAIGCTEILDLQAEWKAVTNNTPVVQAGVILSSSVYNDTALVNALIACLKENDSNLLANAQTTTDLLKSKDSAVAQNTTFTAELITRCNIKTEKASDKLNEIKEYFNVLKDFGTLPALPNDNFYLQ